MRFPMVLEHPEMTPASLIDSATISIYKKYTLYPTCFVTWP